MQNSNKQLEHSFENQGVLNDMLMLALADDPLPDLLERSLKLILSVSWLRLLPQGAFFLSDEKSETLVLTASHELAPQLQTPYASVPFGHGLCGRAAQQKELKFACCADSQNDIHFDEMAPHGHYNVPVMDEDKTVLGVFTLYLERGHKKNDLEMHFLTTVANIMATLIRRKRAEDQLETKRRKLHSLEYALAKHALVSVTDTSGAITYANDKFCNVSQYSREELIGKNHRMLNSAHHSRAFFANMYRTIAKGETWHGEIKNKKKDGSIYWLDATIVPFRNSHGKITHYTSIRTDITSRIESAELEVSNRIQKHRVLELESLKLELEAKSAHVINNAKELRRLKDEQTRTHRYLSTSVNSMRHGFAIWDLEDRLVLANDAYRDFHSPIREILKPGIRFDEMLVRGFEAGIWNVKGVEKHTWIQKQRAIWREGKEFSKELELSDGRLIIYEGQVQMSGEIITILIDVTAHRRRESQLQQANDQIEKIAYFDVLTGLPNRAHCQRDITKRFALDQSENSFAIVQIDLDKFKRVNDTLGHAAGDHLLKQLGSRLDVLAHDIADFKCYRWGGDEFIAVVGCDEQTDLVAICEEMTDLIAIPIPFNETVLRPTVSLGVARYPEDATDFDALMIFADLALYRTKELGRDGYNFFTPDMKEAVDAEALLESEIRFALDEDQFELYFQPQIDLESEKITGLEALLRWNHPERGLLSPGCFLSVVESSGLASKLGQVVFAKATGAIRCLLDAGLEFGRMAVNLSPQHLKLGTLVENLYSAMAEQDIAPEYIAVEVLESFLLDDPNSDIRSVLQKLREEGIQVELDDFGTGYASLSHLTALPISGLKVDRSFVHQIIDDPKKQAVVSALISMANLMKMRVVCEGFETPEQIEAITKIGNCSIQGYFIARPMSFENITKWIREEHNIGALKSFSDTSKLDVKPKCNLAG